MSAHRRIRPAAVIVGLLLATLLAGRQEAPVPAPGPIRLFFTARSAKPDDNLGEAARKEFEDDDGRPLKAVALDLKGDGGEFKFFLSAVPSRSGGYQWLIVDKATRRTWGLIVGSIIFVERENDDGFPRLETFWRQGGDMAVVFNYAYTRGRYVRVDSRSLTVFEINDYFLTKPPIDLDKELVEIKAEHDPVLPPRR